MARLTAAERSALPNSAFADPKDRAYPIEDAAHARAAKGRAAQFAGPKLRAKIDAKADRKLNAGGRVNHPDEPAADRKSHYGEMTAHLRKKHGAEF